MTAHKPSHILLTVLDWGWGHLHRCIPIIQEAQERGYQLTLGSGKSVLNHLHSLFPSAGTLELPAYEGQYRWNNMAMNIAMKSPELIEALELERKILIEQHQMTPFDAIISDGRYGCFLNNCPSFFLSHQVHIKARKKLTDTMANKVHRQWMDNFDEVWVPDFEHPPGLGGQLSHEADQDNCQFLQPISRFYTPCPEENAASYDWLFLVYGPEPSRQHLEERLFQLAKNNTDRNFLFVTPEKAVTKEEALPHISYASQLSAKQLDRAVKKSKHILCRSDFFHLSDLSIWHRTACLVPTPGHPEELYLAEFYTQQYHWPVCMQSELCDLETLKKKKKSLMLPRANDSARLQRLFGRLASFEI